jgi:hypothetical protein
MDTLSPFAYKPALGQLSRPAQNVPRRAIYVGPAYNGMPSRAGNTQPTLPERVLGKMSYRGRMLRFEAVLAGDEYASTTGMPPIGNVIPSPVFRPPAPIVEMTASAPNVVPGRVSRMNQLRRLSALLPNPNNTYQPMRYGEDYDGVRGGGGEGEYE